MTDWTAEERRELEEVRRMTADNAPGFDAALVGLRVWCGGWFDAVKEVAALDLPPAAPPLLRTVLADFREMAPRLVWLCEGKAPPPPEAFRDLLEEAEALEAKATQARRTLPEGEPESPEALALLKLVLASGGLPFQLRHYADTRREVTP